MEKLGISPIQLATQIINFIILAFILKKLLYKPILKTLEERKKKIAQGLEYAQQMEKQREESEKKKSEILDKAKADGHKMIAEAKRTAKTVETEILKGAQKEADSYMEKAKQEIAYMKTEMEKQVQKETVEIATDIVEKVLSQALDDRNQKAIIDRKIHELVAGKHETKTS